MTERGGPLHPIGSKARLEGRVSLGAVLWGAEFTLAIAETIGHRGTGVALPGAWSTTEEASPRGRA